MVLGMAYRRSPAEKAACRLRRRGRSWRAATVLLEAAPALDDAAPADVVIGALEALRAQGPRRRLLWALVTLGACEGSPSASTRDVWRRARAIVMVDDQDFDRWVAEWATRSNHVGPVPTNA